jgi:ribosome-associated protein
VAEIYINRHVSIQSEELSETFTRAGGPGGQHVNTTDSAVLLRFDVMNSPSLSPPIKHRLAVLAGSRLTRDGVLVLRSEGSRSQEMNRREVRERLLSLIAEACVVPKRRRATRPSKAAKAKRVDEKKGRSEIKRGRGKVSFD